MAEPLDWPRRRAWYLRWGRASNRERLAIIGREHWAVTTVILIAGGIVAAWWFWSYIVAVVTWFGRYSEQIRNLALAVGVVAAIFGGWVAYRRSQTDRLRQVTDSFEGAVTLLGHENLSVRLGAIYALERIARQNRDEHWPIMETLTAYVREWSERTQQEPREGWDPVGRVGVWRPAPSDIAAVFTVLGRRRVDHELGGRSTSRRLNLNGAYLARVIPDPPPSRQFEGAVLSGANLAEADLDEANFLKAAFLAANLREAYLRRADLRGAWLHLSNLEEARLYGADLSTAEGLTQEQLNSALGDKDTKIPEDLIRPAHWSS